MPGGKVHGIGIIDAGTSDFRRRRRTPLAPRDVAAPYG